MNVNVILLLNIFKKRKKDMVHICSSSIIIINDMVHICSSSIIIIINDMVNIGNIIIIWKYNGR